MNEKDKEFYTRGRHDAVDYIKEMMVKDGITIDNSFWGSVFLKAKTGDENFIEDRLQKTRE